jgi:hypothetical protein
MSAAATDVDVPPDVQHINTTSDELLGVSTAPSDGTLEQQERGFGPPKGSNAEFGMVSLNSATTPGCAQGSSTRLLMNPVRVRGVCPPEIIVRILRQNHCRFQACYQTVLKGVSRTNNAVELAFEIDETGAVKSPRFAQTTLDVPQFEQCVLTSLQALAFPTTKGTTTVSANLRFQPVTPKKLKR